MTNRITAAVLLAALMATTACNTVKGLGEDIKSVGETGEEVISHAPGDTENVQDVQDAR